MGEPERKLNLTKAAGSSARQHRAVCPSTGVSIPECSCRRCAEAQIRAHAPWLLDRSEAARRAGRPAA